MKSEEFLLKVTELLDLKDPLRPDAELEAISTYDSLGMLNLLDLYDSLGVAVDIEKLKEARTAKDLVVLAGPSIEGFVQ